MNWIQFGRLIYSIYGKNAKLPDLDWIQSLGLLAVKLGQVHALRVDFLSREKCEHLTRLYRRNAVLPPQDFIDLITRTGPPGFVENFSHIEPIALASASVGQVHRARLKTGEEVVIKAVKRNVRESFQRDVASLKRLMHFVTFFNPKLKRVGDPIGILEDIESYTLSELDLRHEVAGYERLEQIKQNYVERFNLSLLKFPRIYKSISNENVMVSEFIPGKSFDELLEAKQLDYAQMLEIFRIQGFYIFGPGVFHGDLHPGNALFDDGKICFVDTGFIGSASLKIRHGLRDFFTALADYDYPLCVERLNVMSEPPLSGAALDNFRKKFMVLYADFAGATVTQVSLTRRMMESIKLGVESGLVFERGIFPIIRSLMYLDGMVLRCKPDAVLMPDMKPFFTQLQKI
jgi:ubiquinone biosynthesis protein